MAVSKRLRYEILRRDNHACRYCGGEAPDVKLTVDHVVPVALGGSDEASNLVAACADCNAGKTSTNPDAPIVDDVEQDALRWSRAMERAAQIQSQERQRFQEYVDDFDSAWQVWTTVDGHLPRPNDYTQALHRFFLAGLETEQIEEAVSITMNAAGVKNDNLYRYFCGVCYRIIEERQTIARSLLEGGA